MRTTALAAATCAAALLISGCGGSDDNDNEPTAAEESSVAADESEAVESESPAAEESAAPFDEADAEAVIQAYFAAQRAGDAAAICALEEPLFQGFKYGEPGQPCLDDLANNTAQTVWADPIVIVSLDVSEFGVDGMIQPNVSTPDQAAITLVPDDDGNLLVSRLQ